MDLIKITPNAERVKSIVTMTGLIEQRIALQDRKTMTALIVADYYEIVKELLTAILLLDGYKTVSHKDLFEYFYITYPASFNAHEKTALDELRVLRNRIAYEGFMVSSSYLERNELLFKKIIFKLKAFIPTKL